MMVKNANNGSTKGLRSRLQSGNAIVMLFAAIGMAGVVTYGLNNVIRGPAVTTAEVSRRTMAENNLIATTRLAIAAAAQQASGDCDEDGFIEPVPYRAAAGAPAPVGGGLVPSTVGASMTDPWGVQYGYCVWDPGTASVSDAVAACGGATPRRLEGAPRDDQYAIAVISAGKNGAFETTCNAFVDTTPADNVPDTVMLNKPGASDDIVLAYSYAEANGIGGGEWKLKTGDATTAEIGKDLEVGNAANPRGATFTEGALEMGGARGLVLPGDPGDDTVTGICNTAKVNQLRRNIGDGSEVPVIEICHDDVWTPVTGGATVGSQCTPDYATWGVRTAAGSRNWQQISMSSDGETIAAVISYSGSNPVYYSHDGGVTWSTGNVSGAWNDIAVSADGNTMYVAEPFAGIRKSTDGGATWGAAVGGSANYATIDASADGSVVASVINGGQIAVSTNGGASYTLRETSRAWYDIVVSANGTRMAALVDNGYIYTSTDSGTTWTQRASQRLWGAIVSSTDGMSLAATVSGGRVWTSTNAGVNWTEQTGFPAAMAVWEIASSADGTKLIATVDGGQLYSSEDSGVTWTARESNRNWNGIAMSADGAKVAAVVNGGGIYTSDGDCPEDDDAELVCGEDWTAYPVSSILWLGLGYANGKFVATGQNRLAYSVDAKNWIESVPPANMSWAGIAYGNGLFVTVGMNGTNPVLTSSDGITWTQRTAPTSNWTSVAYGNGRFVAAAQFGTSRIMTSPDGITWTAQTVPQNNTWNNVAYGNGLFVAVASDGTNRVMTSPDGVTWTMRNAAAVLQWESVIYGGGQFVATSINGTNNVMTSPDGITWTARTSGLANQWRAVTYGAGKYVAVAETGTNRVMTSPDGITWTPQDAPEANGWDNIIYADGKFVAGATSGSANRMMVSTCGASSSDTVTAMPHPLDEGLIAHWKLDEGTGTAVKDSEGANNGVFVNTPVWASEGPHGSSSLNFKKVDRDAVQISGLSGQPSEGTIAAWVNAENSDTGGATIFSIGDNVSLTIDHGTGLTLNYWNGGGTTSTSATEPYFGDGWHYVVATFSSINDAFRVYVDGTAVGSSVATANVSWAPRGTNTFIGRHGNGNTNYDFEGGIDDVRLYGRALSPNEVVYLTERARNESLIRDKSSASQAVPRTGQLNAGPITACAINKDNSLWCWGDNSGGRIGNTTVGTYTAVPVSVAGASDWSQISSDNDVTCGLKTDGSRWCWGTEATGQFGNGGTDTDSSTTPIAVTPGTVWTQIAHNYQHACGITNIGALYCWGANSAGKLGNGNTTQQLNITQVGTDQWKFVTVGPFHTCGIKKDGSGWCWGDDTDGKLGNGPVVTGNQTTPSRIQGGYTWSTISAGSDGHTCGVTTDGKGWCWGGNNNGRLGSNIAAGQTAPYPVFGNKQWKEINVQNYRSCGVTADGEAYCWGGDWIGELGNGATLTATQWVPSRVLLPAPVSTIQPGYNFTCAMAEDYRTWCWGADAAGQLGNGTVLTADQVSPSRVVGFPNPAPFLWNSVRNALSLNPTTTLALGNKWLSDDGTAKYFGFDSAGMAKLAQTASSNQLLLESTLANSSAQMSFKKAEPAAAYVDYTSNVVLWALDDSSGTMATSSSGNIFPGTVSGTAMWNTTGGLFSGALELDGKTARVRVANHAGFRPAATYAIAMLIRPDGIQNAGATILSKSYNNGQYDSYALKFTADQKIAFVTTGAGMVQNTVTSTQAVRPNSWTFVSAFSVDMGGGNVRKAVAINSIITPYTTALAPVYSTDATGDLFFGAGGCVATCNAFKGSMDGLRLYNVEITAAMFEQIYGYNSYAAITPKTIGVDYSTNSLEIGSNNTAVSNWLDTITPDFSMGSGGDIGIGTTAPAAKVDVAGGVRVGYQTYCNGTTSADGALRYTGNSGDETAAAPQSSLPSGAVAHWSFNETSGTTAADSVGGNTGTLVGNATFAAGVKGNALLLDGTGDYMNAGSPAALDDLPQITACAWINGLQGQPSGQYQDIITKVNINDGWGLYTADDSANAFSNIGAQGRGGHVEKDGSIAFGTWSHICMTWDGGGTITSNKPYVNGVEITAPWLYSSTHAVVSDAAYNLTVGSSQHGNGWSGRLDEAVIFNRVLSTAEIQQVMAATGPASIATNENCLRKVSTGLYHGCALGNNKKAYCWGLGTSGRLGDGSSTSSTQPIAVANGVGPGTYKSIDTSRIVYSGTGANFSCGIGTDSRAYCWGNNSNGQLGDTTVVARTTPVAVANGAGPGTYKSISVGTLHVCAIGTDNQAYCWGNNAQGELGDNTTIQRTSPVRIVSSVGPGSYTKISAGQDVTCAIGTDTRIYCWGNNGFRQLADGTVTDRHKPVLSNSGAGPGTYTHLSVSEDHVCAIGTDSRAYCWGDGSLGRLGDNNTVLRAAPTLVVNGASPGSFKDITAGRTHTCAMGTDNKLYCWGSNTYGQLGDNTTTQRNLPTLVLNGESTGTYKEISAGEFVTCGIGNDTRLYCWGDNTDSKLADGTTTQRNTPKLALPGQAPSAYDSCPGETAGTFEYCNGTTWATVGGTSAAAATKWSKKDNSLSAQNGSCAIRADGTVWCWGNDTNERLGNGATSTSFPYPVRTISSEPWRQMSGGDNHACGIKNNGTVWCWGGDNNGQLGNGNVVTANQDAPVQITGTDTWVDISGGYRQTCGIKTDGTAWCWGSDGAGRLGNGGGVLQADSPSQVTGTGTWADIETGLAHSCGIKNDGTAWCWGDDPNGQLGNGATAGQQQSPTQVTGTGTWIDITTGNGHSCGIKNDGTAWCWGADSNGQLGNGATAGDQISPTQVAGTGTWAVIDAGWTHSCGIKTDGTAWCWGSDDYGEGGNGASTGDQTSPVLVTGTGTWVAIQAGERISCGTKSDGTNWCWGRDDFGQLGNGSTLTADQINPTLVE